MIRTSCYLVIRPERRGYDGAVQGIEIDRVVKTKPKLGIRDVAIKLNLQVDERLFTVPEPEVTIDLDDRRALVIPKLDVDVPEGQISAEEAAPLALATEIDPDNDAAYLAGMRTLADEGNPVAIALLEGRWPWPKGTAHPRFEAAVERGLAVVARSARAGDGGER